MSKTIEQIAEERYPIYSETDRMCNHKQRAAFISGYKESQEETKRVAVDDSWADDPRTAAVYEGAKKWENRYEQAIYNNRQIFDVIKKSLVNADDELSRLEKMEPEEHWTQSHKNLSQETRAERKILEKLLMNLAPFFIF